MPPLSSWGPGGAPAFALVTCDGWNPGPDHDAMAMPWSAGAPP